MTFSQIIARLSLGALMQEQSLCNGSMHLPGMKLSGDNCNFLRLGTVRSYELLLPHHWKTGI
jgi:hypothetical protein